MLLYAVAEFVLPDTSRPCTGEIFESINHCKRRFQGYARRRRARQRGLRALRRCPKLLRAEYAFRICVPATSRSVSTNPHEKPGYKSHLLAANLIETDKNRPRHRHETRIMLN